MGRRQGWRVPRFHAKRVSVRDQATERRSDEATKARTTGATLSREAGKRAGRSDEATKRRSGEATKARTKGATLSREAGKRAGRSDEATLGTARQGRRSYEDKNDGLNGRTFRSGVTPVLSLFTLLAGLLGPVGARADDFTDYQLTRIVSLPDGAGPLDVLTDGRVVTLVDDDVYVETAAGSESFSLQGTLPAADIGPFGASYLRVSPDGTRIAVGNNGGVSFANFEVGIFDFPALTGVWFTAESFDAAWFSDTRIALSAGDFSSGIVTALDVTSPDPVNPVNPTIVAGIGGASGGVALDGAGNLYTGNGFAAAGPSGTGAVKAFDAAAWQAAVSGGPAIEFETEGMLVVDVLSASSLGFDEEGNLHVGGGDFNEPDADYAALIRAAVVASATAGGGPADSNDPSEVRRLDPDEISNANFYAIGHNLVTRELYLCDGGGPLYVYAASTSPVPTASTWGLCVLTLLMLTAGSVMVGYQPDHARHAQNGVTR